MDHHDALSRDDIARLAMLHVASLPSSTISLFGAAYARAAYRYFAESDQEVVCIVREGGQIAGACVLSLSPETLSRRLLLKTPLLPHALVGMFGAAGSVVFRALRGIFDRPASADWRALPEMILIFVSEGDRGQGTGRKLLERCEAVLRTRKYGAYIAKTVDAADNRALSFYGRSGFVRAGRVVVIGLPFQVLRRDLASP